MVEVELLEESIARIFLNQIEDLNSVNLEEVVKIMLEMKQDGEKV